MKIVLKIIMMITISFSIFAEDTNVLLKKMQLALDKNQLEVVEDVFDNNEEVLTKNPMAIERLALSFERRGKLKEAIEKYRLLVTVFNKDSHNAILSSTLNPVDSSLYGQNKLPLYYYKLAFLNAQLFKSSNKYIPIEDRKKYLGNVHGYLILCKKVKTEDFEIKTIEDMVKEKIKFESELTFKAKTFTFADIISWQDRVLLINNTTGIKTKILNTVLGTGIGLGRKWENSKYEFFYEGMYVIGKATANSESPNVNYQQSSIAINSIITGPGFYLKTISEKVLFGMSFPVSLRSGDWSLPAGNFSLEDNKQIGVGYFIQSKFYINNFAIQTRIGKIFPNPASHWTIGGIYDF